MSIMWKYLDKRSATIAAIKDFTNMRFIINTTDDEIKLAYDKMSGTAGTRYDDMPRVHDPKAVEKRMLNGIEEIDILKERYRQAMEYMEWFKPAWAELSDEDKYILESFFGGENSYGCNAAYYVADYLNIEPSTAYKRKSRALERLTVLLFGKG